MMDKKQLTRIGMATMSGVPEAEIARNSAKYFEVALATMRAAHEASRKAAA